MSGTDLFSPHPIFVFDGYCVLCSKGASFVMRHDPQAKVRFLPAQSPLGKAIYDHFGLPIDASYLLITPEGTLTKTTGWLALGRILGGGFRLGGIFALVPKAIRDRCYDWLAKNRYRLFGKSDYCALLSPDRASRLVTEDAALRAQLGPS